MTAPVTDPRPTDGPTVYRTPADPADVRPVPDLRRLPCRVTDPDLWFADNPSDLELAKALCVDCPLRTQCLATALERAEPWGVWGGEILDQGVVIPRKRPRGRPRKYPVAA